MPEQDPVTRLNAALEGRYRIERQLGEGGMAVVYLARDLKHSRNVALKVLKPELAAVVGADRFLAEIETTANLQHPHILPLFDSGQADSFLFYVMPYVEGESLREKLDRERQLPVDEAMRIAANVAEALDYAHRHGIIHRDVKPANILLQDGAPVVSDFGIALAVTASGAGRLTETGLSLGTPHYMSPEQATGDLSVGVGSDIYALACVLYEMLVGEPPYTGSTPQAVLGKIIQAKPVSATEMRRTVPANVDAVIRRGLEKVPADRFASAQAFSRALSDPGFRHGGVAAVDAATAHPAQGAGSWNRLTLGFASLAAVFAILAGSFLVRPSAGPPATVRRFVLDLREGDFIRGGTVQPLALTPDGRSVVVNLSMTAGSQLFVRDLASLDLIPIRGTENIGSFLISPDGSWLGFNGSGTQANSSFLKMPVGGGSATTVAPTPGSNGGFRGASWGDAGTIVYSAGAFAGLMSVRDLGGVPDTLTRPPNGERHRSPRILPSGRTVLFELRRGDADPQIAALSVASGEYDVLTQGQDPDFVAPNYLVFRRGSSLWASRFDPARRTLEGEPIPVLEGVRPGRFFSFSDDGTLVYVTGSGASDGGGRLAIEDLDGHRQILPLPPRSLGQVVWSPDGRTVAFVSDNQIYTYDVVLYTTPRQITFDGTNSRPQFSPDGKRLVFSADRDGTQGRDLFVKDLDSDAPPTSLITLDGDQAPTQWPSDTLIVFEQESDNVDDLWTLDIADPQHPQAKPYLTSEYDLRRMTLSPDGRLAAYQSNESGTPEVYLRSFPNPGAQTVVSRGGGYDPAWSPDGNTIYMNRGAPNLPMVAARIRRGSVPQVLSLDTLQLEVHPLNEPLPGNLHPDGDRFIFVVNNTDGAGNQEAQRERIVLVENFVEELKRLLGK